jgi:hypothetical protein
MVFGGRSLACQSRVSTEGWTVGSFIRLGKTRKGEEARDATEQTRQVGGREG